MITNIENKKKISYTQNKKKSIAFFVSEKKKKQKRGKIK